MIVNDQLIIPLCKALSPHQPRGGGRQAERRGLRLEPAPPRLQHCSRFGRLLAHLEDRQPYVSEASPQGKTPDLLNCFPAEHHMFSCLDQNQRT